MEHIIDAVEYDGRFDTAQLMALPPRKHSKDVRLSKVFYKEEGCKLLVTTPARLVKSQGNVLYVQAPKRTQKLALDIDDAVVGLTATHLVEWFADKIRAEVLNEFFQPSLVVHRKYKHLVRFHLVNTLGAENLREGAQYNLTISPFCILVPEILVPTNPRTQKKVDLRKMYLLNGFQKLRETLKL